jgi:non-heme chloroperoxidase
VNVPASLTLDDTVPHAIAHASFKQQQSNPGVTELIEMKNRGHALTIDPGWRGVAQTALAFVQRFARTTKEAAL